MSHEVETMAYVGETPWHGLGNKVSECVTTDEMLVAAGLNWTVSKRPLAFSRYSIAETLAIADNTAKLEMPALIGSEKNADNIPALLENVPTAASIWTPFGGDYALVRDSDNTILSLVGADYTPIQNETVMEFFRRFLEAGGLALETAGSLRDGKQIWAQARLPKKFSISGDVVEAFLLAVSPHERGKAMQFLMTATRVVCANTMAIALKNGTSNVRVVHRKEFNEAYQAKARGILGNAYNEFGHFEVQARLLADTRIDRIETIKLLAPIVQPGKGDDAPTPDEIAKRPELMDRVFRAIMGRIEYAEGTQAVPGSAWAAFNGLTYYADHDNARTAQARLEQSNFGKMSTWKAAFLKSLITFADTQKAADELKHIEGSAIDITDSTETLKLAAPSDDNAPPPANEGNQPESSDDADSEAPKPSKPARKPKKADAQASA